MAKEYAKSFYHSKEWQACREAYVQKRIKEDGGRCERCGAVIGHEVHHIEPITLATITDPRVTLNHDNLQLLCRDCHFAVHRAMILAAHQQDAPVHVLQRGCYVDDDGQLHNQARHIVNGAPGSGRHEYVARHRHPLDLVVDLDALRYATGWTGNRKDNNLLAFSIRLRDWIYEQIEEQAHQQDTQAEGQDIDCRNVWIIIAEPNKGKRQELAERLGADLIEMNSTPEDCRERIRRERRRNETFEIALSEKFFERYQR